MLRPEVGTQPQFKKRKQPKKYRYDDSLSPALDWDGQNPGREVGEWLLSQIEEAARLDPPHRFPEPRQCGDLVIGGLDDALAALKALSAPFLNWAGKAERVSFDVPTLPLFVHERLSTKAILETLKAHERDRQMELQLFGDPQLSLAQQLEAYEHTGGWVNRLILGDSLTVMNSMLNYEGLGGQVQMIYIDPPYGVKFGSNFQPFVRNRSVKDSDDASMTREPEMVMAYRDTWELGLHSYLTYVRDRLLMARELLHPSGSLFFQISDENLHHVKELLDEVFGPENFVVVICYRRLGMMVGETIQSTAHYLVWYARDRERLKARKLFKPQIAGVGTGDHYTQFENDRPFQLISLTTGGFRPNTTIDYEFAGHIYNPGPNKCWRTTKQGLDRLVSLDRLVPTGKTLRYKQYLDDFPLVELGTIWTDAARDQENFYVVQNAVDSRQAVRVDDY